MSSICPGGQTLRAGAPSAGGITPKWILARLERISVWSLTFMFQFSPSTRGRYFEHVSP